MSEVVESRSRGEPRSQGGGGSGQHGKNTGSQPHSTGNAHNQVDTTAGPNGQTTNSVQQNPGNGQGGNNQGQQGNQQDFSWRVGSAQQQQMEAYSNFYYPAGAAAAAAGYSPFSGDIRDSIAAIWSRTSPSGEGFAAASGGYGQGEGLPRLPLASLPPT
jgi:hypothetical protein